MSYKLLFIVNCLLVFSSSSCGGYQVDRDMTIRVFHSVSEDPFEPQWFETGKTTVTGVRSSEVKQTGLDMEAWRKLIELMNISDSLPYRIKVNIKIQDKDWDFLTFLQVKYILFTDLRYSLTISLDHDYLPVGVCAKAIDYFSLHRPVTEEVSTDIHFKIMETAPQPDTATFIHKMEKEREAKERGANQDNRSFLAKYWIYILPVLIFAILSGSVNTEGAGNSR